MTRRARANAPAARLLAAHLAFELEQWRGAAASARLRETVDAVWRWAEHTPLEDVVDHRTVSAALRQALLDGPPPPELAATLSALVDDLRTAAVVDGESRVREVIDEALFDEAVALFVDLDALRNRLIRRVVDSPAASTVAADLLYRGIKDYIFSDSGALRSIPGISTLLRGSSNALNKRLPRLEAEVEKRVRAYIENNTAQTLARSEAYLLDSLDAATIHAAAGDFWDAIKDRPLSDFKGLETDEFERLVVFGVDAWRALRETDYAATLFDAAVRVYFHRHGRRPLAEVLAGLGFDIVFLRAQAEAAAPAVIDELDENGLLEAIIRRRLAAFYESPEFARAFAAAADRSE